MAGFRLNRRFQELSFKCKWFFVVCWMSKFKPYIYYNYKQQFVFFIFSLHLIKIGIKQNSRFFFALVKTKKPTFFSLSKMVGLIFMDPAK